MDIACTVFSGVLGYEIFDLAIYIGGNGFGILTRYPNPETSNYGHVMIFSQNVINKLIEPFFLNSHVIRIANLYYTVNLCY